MTLSSRQYLTLLVLASLAAAVFFISYSSVDLWVEHQFANSAQGFPYRFHPVARAFNKLINVLAVLLIVFSLAGLVVTSIGKKPWLSLWRRQYGFLFTTIILGPGLIANLIFKEHWGRARPRQIIEFGGTQDFTPPLFMTDQCDTNCSFVSGDASMGFALLAVTLILPWGRKLFVPTALLFGFFIGGIRMVQGAHFLSDVLFAGLFVTTTIVGLYAVLLENWDPMAQKSPQNSLRLWTVLFPEHLRRASKDQSA